MKDPATATIFKRFNPLNLPNRSLSVRRKIALKLPRMTPTMFLFPLPGQILPLFRAFFFFFTHD